MDYLTKLGLFQLIKTMDLVDRLAKLHVNEVIRLYGVPILIISDWNPRFTSRLWQSLQRALRAKVNLRITFHPRTYGQFERTIHAREDFLRSCVLEFKEIEKTYCHQWSLHLIIATKLLLAWLCTKHYRKKNCTPIMSRCMIFISFFF